MDPIVLYATSPDFYWKSEKLRLGDTSDIADILKNDFKARYVFLAKFVEPALYDKLLSDGRFMLKSENITLAVFELKQ